MKYDDVPAPNNPNPRPPHLQAEAERWVRRLQISYTILGIYAAFSLMWFAIDMADGTESLWFYWPMLGTGPAVAIAASVLIGIGGLFGAGWETEGSNATSANAATGTRPGSKQLAAGKPSSPSRANHKGAQTCESVLPRCASMIRTTRAPSTPTCSAWW